MTPSPGEIWLAEIPFTDGSASKIRPALVLWLDAWDAVVAADCPLLGVEVETKSCAQILQSPKLEFWPARLG